ncbi:hypothetical protein BC828DRAFT_376004, partial [Blastocladiella britannica]
MPGSEPAQPKLKHHLIGFGQYVGRLRQFIAVLVLTSIAASAINCTRVQYAASNDIANRARTLYELLGWILAIFLQRSLFSIAFERVTASKWMIAVHAFGPAALVVLAIIEWASVVQGGNYIVSGSSLSFVGMVMNNFSFAWPMIVGLTSFKLGVVWTAKNVPGAIPEQQAWTPIYLVVQTVFVLYYLTYWNIVSVTSIFIIIFCVCIAVPAFLMYKRGKQVELTRHADLSILFFGAYHAFRLLSRTLGTMITTELGRKYTVPILYAYRFAVSWVVLHVDETVRIAFGVKNLWLSFPYRLAEVLAVVTLSLDTADLATVTGVVFAFINLAIMIIKDTGLFDDLRFYMVQRYSVWKFPPNMVYQPQPQQQPTSMMTTVGRTRGASVSSYTSGSSVGGFGTLGKEKLGVVGSGAATSSAGASHDGLLLLHHHPSLHHPHSAPPVAGSGGGRGRAPPIGIAAKQTSWKSSLSITIPESGVSAMGGGAGGGGSTGALASPNSSSPGGSHGGESTPHLLAAGAPPSPDVGSAAAMSLNSLHADNMVPPTPVGGPPTSTGGGRGPRGLAALWSYLGAGTRTSIPKLVIGSSIDTVAKSVSLATIESPADHAPTQLTQPAQPPLDVSHHHYHHPHGNQSPHHSSRRTSEQESSSQLQTTAPGTISRVPLLLPSGTGTAKRNTGTTADTKKDKKQGASAAFVYVMLLQEMKVQVTRSELALVSRLLAVVLYAVAASVGWLFGWPPTAHVIGTPMTGMSAAVFFVSVLVARVVAVAVLERKLKRVHGLGERVNAARSSTGAATLARGGGGAGGGGSTLARTFPTLKG